MQRERNYLIKSAVQLRGAVIAILLTALCPQTVPAFYNFNCSSCHGMPPLDGPRDGAYGSFRGNHQTHQPVIASMENCAICHNAVSFTTGHYDGRISFVPNINNSPGSGSYNIEGLAVAFRNQTSIPALGSCSGVNCHFQQSTPVWGSAPFKFDSPSVNDCNRCHGTGSPSSAPNDGSHPGTGSMHGTYFGSDTRACGKCHPDHTVEAASFAHATSAGNRGLLVRFDASPNNGFGRYSGNVAYPDYLPSLHPSRNGVCRNLYCHSPGTKASSVDNANVAAVWGSSLPANCTGCHKSDRASGTPMDTGSHARHVSTYGYSTIACVKCHAVTATTAMTVKDVSKHVNGSVDIAFNSRTTAINGRYNGSAVPVAKAAGAAYGTCENVYCHSTVQPDGGVGAPTYMTPVWGNNVAMVCGTCHADGSSHSVGAAMSTGSHTKHLNALTGYPRPHVCGACHNIGGGTFDPAPGSCNNTLCHIANAAKHVNGSVDVSMVAYFGGSASYSGTRQPGDAYGACTSVYCHSDGQAVPVTYATAVWGNPASGACGTCHGVLGATPPASTSHARHVGAAAAYRYSCSVCHSSIVQATADSTIQPTVIDSAKHVNKARDVRFNSTNPYGAYSSASMTCRNVYCHSIGKTAVSLSSLPPVYRPYSGGGAYASPRWSDVGPLSCNSCHGRSTADGMPDYTSTGAAGSAAANSHVKHVASSAIACSECHERTTKSNTSIRSSRHANGAADVFFNLSGANRAGSYAAGAKTCSSTYCHGTASSVAWGGSTDCVSCHGATFTTFSSMAKKGAHGLHVQLNTLPATFALSGDGNLSPSASYYQFGCASCHSPARAGHANALRNSSGGAAEVFFGYTSAAMKGTYVPGVLQSGTDNGFTWSAGTGCNTSYCHSNGQGGIGLVNVAWNDPRGTLGCNGCHGNAMSNTLSGKHAQHVNPASNGSLGAGNGLGCVMCHAKTLANGNTIGDKRFHVNKFIDYSSPRGGGGGRYNRSAKECSNIYCHSNGNPGAIVYVTPPAWYSASTLGCNGCHGTGSQVGGPDYANGGAGTATANSHYAHTRSAAATTICADCHAKTASGTTNGAFKDYSAATYHINRKADVNFGSRAGASAAYNGGQCSNVACHGNVAVDWGSTGGGCLTCHSGPIGGRAAIGPQFSANSHHVQGATVTAAHCFQCHWEANEDGTINYAYHDSATSGGPVDLVIYGAGSRPATYAEGTTAVKYTANGSRTEIAKINTHCLGCHSDANNAVTPFGDGKSPKQYSWDGNSIKARYGDTTTTAWSKYSGNNVTPKNTVTKALSAHGNATANHGGFNTSETWPDTRNGSAIVLCFDCHNSHGSTVSGTTTSYASATTNGGILKDVSAGKGGYSMNYKPASGGSAAQNNIFNAGAGLCFDCHLTASAGTKPWGYNATFGAAQAILGFMDTPYFGDGTFPRQTMFSYKATPNMGGHFGASSALSVSASRSINGLCTPCHDPHGVSPSLGANKIHAVPLLKGTWMTNPYKEDVAPATNETFVGIAAVGYTGDYEGPTRSQTKLDTQRTYMKAYKIDQNTFGPGTNSVMHSTAYGITESDAQFAGLCLNCHAKNTLTNGTSHTWTSKDRIHEAVKGWKTANGTIQHKFTCSKCHAPHNAGLPRLMVSNCLDFQHKGRVTNNTASALSGSYRGSEGSGSGRWPGSYSALVGEGGRTTVNQAFTCHENNDTTQKWNVKTRWNDPNGIIPPDVPPPAVPVLIAEPDGYCSYNCSIQLQWNPYTIQGWGTTQYQVQVSDSNTFGTIRYSSSWQTGTSWSVSLSRGTWYWRVNARNSANTSQTSGWSAYDRFLLN